MSREIPVGYVAAAQFVAGAEATTADWLRRTPGLGYGVAWVFCQAPGPAPEHYARLGLRVVVGSGRRARDPLGLVADVRAIRRLLARTRVPLVHAVGAKAQLYAALAVAGRPAAARVVTVLHDPPGTDLLTRASFMLPAVRLANSEVTAEVAAARYPPRPRVVRLGVDPALYAFDAGARQRFRSVHGLEGASPLVAYVGRLQRWKGVENVLAGAAHAAPALPALRVVVVGSPDTDDDRAYELELRRQAETDLPGRVTWVPRVADVREALSAADVVVHSPVVPEPFGRVVVEAMAAGRFVVAGAAGGPATTLDQRAGRLVPERDPVAIAAAIGDFAADPALAEAAARFGPQAADRWSAAASAADLVSEYDRLMADPLGLLE